jgi:hypothetical protein
MSESIGSKVRAAQVVLGGFFDAKSCKDAGAILDVVYDLLVDAREAFGSDTPIAPAPVTANSKPTSSPRPATAAEYESFMQFLGVYCNSRLVKDKNALLKEEDLFKDYSRFCNVNSLIGGSISVRSARYGIKEKFGVSFSKGVYKGIRIKIDGEDVSGNFIDTPQ